MFTKTALENLTRKDKIQFDNLIAYAQDLFKWVSVQDNIIFVYYRTAYDNKMKSLYKFTAHIKSYGFYVPAHCDSACYLHDYRNIGIIIMGE